MRTVQPTESDSLLALGLTRPQGLGNEAPWKLCLADGRRVPVKHPEFVAMNNRVGVVLDEESFSTTIEPLLVVSLEPSKRSGNAGNGSSKRKPKS